MTLPPAPSALSTPAARARAIRQAGGLAQALAAGVLGPVVTVPLVEAVLLGLLRQGVSKYFAVFGHGNTALGDVLRQYEAEGVVRTFQFRNEVAMAHAATQLRWQYNELAAVVTSIGPGSLQAFAASLAAASNGVGVYHLYGDETTHGEGYNMQQIPRQSQGGYGMLTAMMGNSFTLHTPDAVREAMRRGSATVHHPYKAGPFYLLLPINIQPREVAVNLATLPEKPAIPPVAPAASTAYQEAIGLLGRFDRIVLKAGGGARHSADAVRALAERIGAAVVLSPHTAGLMPEAHPLNMHVGGAKGSISGNFAMAGAELLLAVGTRAVCQSDCSGIGYPNARAVININGDVADALHYANTHALVGDVGAICERLIGELDAAGFEIPPARTSWLAECRERKREWRQFRTRRLAAAPPVDEVWRARVMTQPQAIATALDFAREVGAVKLFDAGDVQANGFQLVEDEGPFETFTEAGASYMGFAVSGLLASAAAETPRYAIAFTGDGSFMMNPQVLIDAVEHKLAAMIVVFDNRRMAAITNLQRAQYGAAYRTGDTVAVDYVRLASAVQGVEAYAGGHTRQELFEALRRAYSHKGLSLVHVPVYGGPDEVGGLGAYGDWNVGNWCAAVEARYREQTI